jgi:hypothetical protein
MDGNRQNRDRRSRERLPSGPPCPRQWGEERRQKLRHSGLACHGEGFAKTGPEIQADCRAHAGCTNRRAILRQMVLFTEGADPWVALVFRRGTMSPCSLALNHAGRRSSPFHLFSFSPLHLLLRLFSRYANACRDFGRAVIPAFPSFKPPCLKRVLVLYVLDRLSIDGHDRKMNLAFSNPGTRRGAFRSFRTRRKEFSFNSSVGRRDGITKARFRPMV